MIKQRKIVTAILISYLLTLAWGQLRLPTAAATSLSDYALLKTAPSISASDDQLQMLTLQKWHLKRSLNIVQGNTPPHISSNVVWNAGIIARVHTSYYNSSTGAEGLDGLYVCFFGAWLRIHSFMHVMA